jgi:hypothetical protein
MKNNRVIALQPNMQRSDPGRFLLRDQQSQALPTRDLHQHAHEINQDHLSGYVCQAIHDLKEAV